MKIEPGPVTYTTTPEDATLMLQAAAIFNALGESESGAGEYSAVVETTPDAGKPHSLTAVRIGFLAGNHLVNPMDWNECKVALYNARDYLVREASDVEPLY